jgi:hypothetical protein
MWIISHLSSGAYDEDGFSGTHDIEQDHVTGLYFLAGEGVLFWVIVTFSMVDWASDHST